jgi:hypothetical protein
MSDYIQRFSIVHYTTAGFGESDNNAGSPTKRIKIEGDPHSCYYSGYERTGSPTHCWLSRVEYDLFSSDDDTVIADCTLMSTNQDTTGPSVYYSSLSFGGTTSTSTIISRPTISPKNYSPSTSTTRNSTFLKGILKDPNTRSANSSSTQVFTGIITRAYNRATGVTTTVNTFNRDWSVIIIDKPRTTTSTERIAGDYKGAYSCYVVVPLYTKEKSLVVNQVLGHVAYGNKVYYYYKETQDYYEEPTPVLDIPASLYLWVRQCRFYRKFVTWNIYKPDRLFRYQVGDVQAPETHEANHHVRALKQVTHLFWDDEDAIKLYKYSYWKPVLLYEKPSIFHDRFAQYITPDFELYTSPWYYRKQHTEHWMQIGDYWAAVATDEDKANRRQWIYSKLLEQYIYRKPST